MNESIMTAALAMQTTTSLHAIARIAESFVQRHDVDKFAVAFVRKDGVEATEFVPLSNISAEFLALYAERDYFLLDPLAQYCLKTTTPFVWEETLALRDQEPIVKRIYSEATEFGMSNGITMPIRSFEGLKGSVTFAGDRAKFGLKERTELEILGLIMHARIGELCHEIASRASTIKLTDREQETLKWGALGKTSDDIAGILGLTKRTVDQHFENAGRKLGTVNRVQTVVKAFRHNLIGL
ncbi:MAG TPA: LuxR family transcriptional regulator [Devosiaceae bacterium]